MNRAEVLEGRLKIVYVVLDLIAGSLAYLALHAVRKLVVEPTRFGVELPLEFDDKFLRAALLTSFLYVLISALGGTYRDLTRKSRLKQAFNTLSATVMTSTLLFFLIFLDDYIKFYSQYYTTLGTYAATLLVTSGLFRFSLASYVRHQLDSKKLTFRTILIGAGKEAGDLLDSFKQERTKGYEFIGYMTMNGEQIDSRIAPLPYLGTTALLKDVANDNHVEDVIIAQLLEIARPLRTL